MQTLAYTFIDRRGWPYGPWTGEPDKLQFTDEDTGLLCLIVRNLYGHLCGYVGVADGHPAFRRDYISVDVRVHGGLTYSDFCFEAPDHTGVCHIPDAGEPERVWWLGFDCAHPGDLCPAIPERWNPYSRDVYRDLAYVKSEIRELAGQLAAMPRTEGAA